jgi:hypothetical protein
VDNQSLASRQVGDVIEFGTYSHTKKGKDKTPIEWIVLDNNGEDITLVSKYILDSVPYNAKKGDITWDKCTLRQWLNNDFYNNAFDQSQKSMILNTELSGNGKASGDKVDTLVGTEKFSDGKQIEAPTKQEVDAPITQDNVWLLNTNEAKMYFDKTVDRVTKGTEFACGKKSYTGKLDVYKDHSWWWLRNQGTYAPNLAALVDNAGNVNPIGDNSHFEHGGVRPSIKIKLS